MAETIRVMLIEDHPEYRDVIDLALAKVADIELTSQFGTAERALGRLLDHRHDEHPNIILVDLNLPGISGFEAIPQLQGVRPEARIIVLTQSDKEADVLRAISLGASGYLLKSSALQQITDGIRTVMEGGASLDAKVASFLLETLRTKLPKSETDALLTEREMEVLSLLSEGLVRKEIASQLHIVSRTVSTHIESIYQKLNVNNAPAAIARAFRLGLFPPENVDS